MPKTPISHELAAFLTNPEAAAANRGRRHDMWLLAKERQGHPIHQPEGDRLLALESRITGRPLPARVEIQGDPDPTSPAGALSEVEAGLQRAKPAISRAVAALKRLGGNAA